jgi:LmbE family N-acetylglucosaminyl deacetylase
MNQKTVRGRRWYAALQLLPLLMVCLAVAFGSEREQQRPAEPPRKLRAVVFGAHPDDPETGAGGLIALLTQAGHEVIAAYATCFRRGREIGGEPEAAVRRREAAAACKILGATAKVFPYAHEDLLHSSPELLQGVSSWLTEIQPDIVVTHWPLDSHWNHLVTSSLVWRSYRRQGGWNLYFFEVMTGQQTQVFDPDLYLDIESVRAIKKQACESHRSQHPEQFWPVHEQMHRRRGLESGVRYAEAYRLAEAKPGSLLLPVRFLAPASSTKSEGPMAGARLPGPFAPGVDQTIIRKMHEQVRRVQNERDRR